MVGTVAQMISLISNGNDYFSTKVENKELMLSSTFQFCRFLTFKVKTADKTIYGGNEIIIGDPYEWMRYIENDGCINLRLLYRRSDNEKSAPDYMTAGFIGGGGQWFIEAVYADKSVLWASRWIANKFGAQDNRIWEVTYMNIGTKDMPENAKDCLNSAKNDLMKSLIDIEKFAIDTNRGEWSERFRSAITELEDSEQNAGYCSDLLIDKNYSLAARQLLAGAQKAWVFGGMGWWNDFIYKNKEDQTINENLSAELYYNICNAIVNAVNSYKPNNTI